MACYYKINEPGNELPMFEGFRLQKIKKLKASGPQIHYDFSNHVLIELLDDCTSESEIWRQLGLTNNKTVVHKRIMVDAHRVKCRRAIVICISSDEAKLLVHRVSQTMVMNRCVCAVVIQELLSDLCLFEKQIIQFGDSRPQQQLLYVSDLNRCREPSGLVKFLKEKFSRFGTILSVLVCPDDDGYAYPEGVIKFAYLSEAFAAELALDQFVIGKERLSVITHHNILLSQCDLRVRLRDAQWCNAESHTFSESPFHSYELNDMSTFAEDPVVNSIRDLHISSQNIKFVDDKSQNDISGSKSNQSSVNFPCDKSALTYLRMNKDSIIYSREKPFFLKGNNESMNDLNNPETHAYDIFKPNTHTDENLEVNNISSMLQDNGAALRCTNPENMLLSDKSELNHRTSQHIGMKKDSKITDSISHESCDPNSVAHSTHFSTKAVFNSFHSDDLNALSEYISSSLKHKEMSSLHNNSDSKRKLATEQSKKRKHFTPSQKLCLKSQRICLSQNTVESADAKSEFSNSSSSNKSIKRNKIDRGYNVYNTTSEDLFSLPEDAASSKVTNWLVYLPSSQTEKFNIEAPSMSLKNLNRISVHNRPSLKVPWDSESESESNSDDSSVENLNPGGKNLLTKEDFVALQSEKFHSPLQAWLKQELVSATNNSVIKSQETTKSIIVCAAKTKDVIISVGCSHMTCEYCYPQSTDLLLGFS